LKAFDDPAIADLIEDREQDFRSSTLVVERLSNLTNNISTVGIALSLIFAFIAALMVFNTIRITIYTYREEIGIMKLVGASNGFIRAPFIVESLLYAFLACVVTMAVLLPVLNATGPFFDRFFEGYDIDFIGYFNRNFFSIFGVQLLAVCALSMISSGIAVSRYLRV
jgi:cell division transport system permease protein